MIRELIVQVSFESLNFRHLQFFDGYYIPWIAGSIDLFWLRRQDYRLH